MIRILREVIIETYLNWFLSVRQYMSGREKRRKRNVTFVRDMGSRDVIRLDVIDLSLIKNFGNTEGTERSSL